MHDHQKIWSFYVLQYLDELHYLEKIVGTKVVPFFKFSNFVRKTKMTGHFLQALNYKSTLGPISSCDD